MIASWYVIRTDPRCEHQAATEIRELGWEVFLPCISSPDLRARHPRSTLFPGYLFVKFPLTHENQVSVSRARHVAGWVHFEHTIIDVPDEIIRELQSRLEAVNRNHGSWTRFHAGQKVLLTSKVFEGLAEVVDDSISARGRVKVVLEFMDRLVNAHVPWEDLRPVEPEHTETYRLPRRTRGGGRRIRSLSPPEAVPA